MEETTTKGGSMSRLKIVGVLMALAGLGFTVVGGVVFSMAQAGLDSLDAVYEAQGVTLSYNEDGEFIDRGQVEGGDAILSLLEDDWDYPLNRKNLDPDDPLVNTPDELMVQYATIAYHVLHGTHTVELEEDVEYNGEVFEAGTYEVDVDGRYWTDFDRMHPLEGPVRSAAWSPTAQALLAQISTGVASDFQAEFARGMSIVIVVLGLTFIVSGGGMIWAGKREE